MTNLRDESKTDLSLRRKCCEKFLIFQGCTQSFQYITQLCVTQFCPKTPRQCPRTTTDMPMSAPVAVHIDFCGYLQYFCISSVQKYTLQYATENHSDVN
jgi:hypothetical protein